MPEGHQQAVAPSQSGAHRCASTRLQRDAKATGLKPYRHTLNVAGSR